MQIIRKKQFHIDDPTAVAIGKFDSLHLGHKVILERLKREAECCARTAVFSFEPGPEVFFGRYSGGFILTEEEKIALLEEMGIDYYILFPFDAETAGTPPQVFLNEILKKQMNMQIMVAGEDVSFGKDGLGNAEFVQEKAKELDFKACICHKLSIEGDEVSATMVRNAVLEGDIEKCNLLLGRPFQISGIIEHGNQIGRTLGVPTCNIFPCTNKLLPPRGVYFTNVFLKGKQHRGVTNVGVRPTVSQEPVVCIETYLLDFEEDVYGEWITLDFMHFHRPEQKFQSLEQLKQQLNSDILDAKQFFCKK